MSVIAERQVKRFIGLSTDKKPIVGETFNDSTVTDADLPAGSTFLETDIWLADGTQRIARWNGEAWTYPLPSAETSTVDSALIAAIDALRLEVAALRLGMIEAGTCKFVNENDAADLAVA